MTKILLAACLLVCSSALAADGGVAAEPGAKEKGPAANAKPALDLSKMPFTPQSIQEVVAAHMGQIQSCYEDTLAAKGEKVVEGKLQAHWTITGEGIVKGAKIEKKGTTLKDPKLHECVVAVILAMEFPKPPKNRDQPIDYPFNLKAIK